MTPRQLKRMSTIRIQRCFRSRFGYTPNVTREGLIAMLFAKLHDLSHEVDLTTRMLETMVNRKLIEGMRKLTDCTVRSMRIGHDEGVSYAYLSALFGTSAKRTRDICLFKAYKEIR